MKTETELRLEGTRALIAALGEVDAERFIAVLSRESFDYTHWRKTGLPDMSVEALSTAATEYQRNQAP